MNAPDNLYLPDVQASADARNLAIQRVGIKSLLHPVQVATVRGPQPSVASIDMFVGLPADQKGTHMSRFIDVLQTDPQPLAMRSTLALLERMIKRLEARTGFVQLRLPFFVRKSAPVSGVESVMDYQVTLTAERTEEAVCYMQKVVVPVSSLCPQSKKVADFGAHNQRAYITIGAQLADELAIEQQIRMAEDASSCELWALLKRSDEKYVTERAYSNPKFVEDVVRDLAITLDSESRIVRYVIEAENFESIHNHSAYALMSRDKRTGG